ncbi:putative recombination initiation defects 3 isoform X3 [Vicia villosa]|uniref:putative recombination initiation defects 3 isoform X3 n=1 Tax=Vicia villosa TaxID=3911 RepID=UPI00273AE480|nr:putative recombination initiation defects 3 isoform X3 [Vicia villosa]XP_058743989.1 putative recombination initiation defects 3 isoform X3 [Vicia villosa]
MKMKINKAADLSSISVFPPPHIFSRRPNNVSNGLQASQHRSQPSQQSFSQGISSQQGILSHFSQSSLDEAITANDQRAGSQSQEHENSSRRFSSLPRLAFPKDESQPHNSRSSSNLLVKWNSVDNKNQLSEGLENRIGIMETSLSRFAMIMDSVQSDVMQVNKGTKEINLEMECIRQKLIAQDNSLQLMMKGQEELKASINESLKSLSEQMSRVTNIEKLQEVFTLVSTMPQLIEGSLRNLQNDLQNTNKEMQEISRSLKHTNQKDLALSILSPKCVSKQFITPKVHQRPANETKMNTPAIAASKVDTGGWMPVKRERVTFSDRITEKVQKQIQPHTEKIRGARDCAIVIESDEETDGKFSCVVGVNADLFGNLSKEEEEEAERILRNARRRKRKRNSMITIF